MRLGIQNPKAKTPQRKTVLEIRAERTKKTSFKPNIKSATAVIGAIAFLQKTGLGANVRNIKTYIKKRCNTLPDSLKALSNYLARGVELGILKKHAGAYKIEDLMIKKRRKMKNVRRAQVKPRSKHKLSLQKMNVVNCDESRDTVTRLPEQTQN
nr:unnamed protein product [Callosobruchus analis]CAI5824542.1 unnamed protein product [Callosobruchus analis]